MNENKNILKERDGFNSKWGFILACIGSAVGMGNIWRFPVMVSQYGGMTFLIPYFLLVILYSFLPGVSPLKKLFWPIKAKLVLLEHF